MTTTEFEMEMACRSPEHADVESARSVLSEAACSASNLDFLPKTGPSNISQICGNLQIDSFSELRESSSPASSGQPGRKGLGEQLTLEAVKAPPPQLEVVRVVRPQNTLEEVRSAAQPSTEQSQKSDVRAKDGAPKPPTPDEILKQSLDFNMPGLTLAKELAKALRPAVKLGANELKAEAADAGAKLKKAEQNLKTEVVDPLKKAADEGIKKVDDGLKQAEGELNRAVKKGGEEVQKNVVEPAKKFVDDRLSDAEKAIREAERLRQQLENEAKKNLNKMGQDVNDFFRDPFGQNKNKK